jgi:hypothetical protein
MKYDDFTRFMRAAGFDFEVARNPWSLYISNQQYGSLGAEEQFRKAIHLLGCGMPGFER